MLKVTMLVIHPKVTTLVIQPKVTKLVIHLHLRDKSCENLVSLTEGTPIMNCRTAQKNVTLDPGGGVFINLELSI